MLIDGRKIAADIYEEITSEVQKRPKAPHLTVVTCAPNFETRKYLELKKRHSQEVGITLNIIELPVEASTYDAVTCIQTILPYTDAVVVQLPLPSHIDREAVLDSIPSTKDPDVYSYEPNQQECLPPVIAAIDEMAALHNVAFSKSKVVVLGAGRLVGGPAAKYAKAAGAEVSVIDKESTDISAPLAEADIIITGIGQPNYITPDMVKAGVIVFDAGTSEDGGALVGDVHAAVADKAELFTPVPGGIGPVTVATLLRNVIVLTR